MATTVPVLGEDVLPRGVYVHHPAVRAVSASGSRLKASDGGEYIDFTSGLGVTALGHCHPAVVEAVVRQASILLHSCQHVAIPEITVELARELAKRADLGGRAVQTLLVNSGAEAVENAVKIAKAATGRRSVIALENAFHGRTAFALALTGKVRPYAVGFGQAGSGVFHAPAPYCFRCPRRQEPCCTLDADFGLRGLLNTQVAPEEVAALIVEPIQGEGGFVVPPAGWLADVEALCREHGIVLIADEVQSGIGRTGKFWAYEHDRVTPDLVCVGKGVANGMPLAAVVGRAELMRAPAPGGLGGTYGGNPVCAAAALAVLAVIDRDRVLEHVAALGEIVVSRLRYLAGRVPTMADVRGRGLMQAVEFVDGHGSRVPRPDLARGVVEAARDRGLLLLTAGLHGNVVRLLPPLTITEASLLEGLDVLEEAIETSCGQELSRLPERTSGGEG